MGHLISAVETVCHTLILWTAKVEKVRVCKNSLLNNREDLQLDLGL